ncbi:MAG: zinc-binding alcohol dehydrogenase family protein [Bacteroidaceae bacterium]|nr:zinc-binding alcohol dehydrogenase family protein [Bacteroidaceae bacterium]
MRQIRIPAQGEMIVEQAPKPVAGAGEVLLKIKYAGFCGSDLNTFLGRNLMAKKAVIPGHEIGAEIESTGTDVPGFLLPGLTVTVNPYTNCGHCAACRSGHSNACEFNETLGVQRDGAMRDYMVLPWQKIIPAQGISARDCALIEPMSVGFHAVSRAQVTDSDTVLVFGCGMIGVGAIVRASLRGATVIAVDLDNDKLALARRLGAAHTINSKEQDLHATLTELTGGLGPTVVVEAVGSVPTYQAAIDEVAFSGRVVCIGYSKNDVTFHTGLFVKKELHIFGSRNALPMDFDAVIRYLRQGNCPKDELISAVVKPEEALSAMQKWVEAPGKVFRILVNFN